LETSNEEESHLKTFPPGTHREIFYNPANPAEIDWSASSGYAVNFGLGAMGLALVVAGAFQWRRSQPAEW
jgi:hypothetical protein